MEETLLLEKRTKNRASSLCIGGGIRTHMVTLASDFEWLYRFCFPQQSALHRSQKALILLAFLTFSCFY